MPPDFHILLIEDSSADVVIIDRALREGGMFHRLTVIPDGRLALDYLRGLLDPSCSFDLIPDLILLDLNLPGIDGHQVLTEIKSQPFLRSLPVLVLTTSGHEHDVERAYAAGANSYLQKPSEFPSYVDLANLLRSYWIETTLRPSKQRSKG